MTIRNRNPSAYNLEALSARYSSGNPSTWPTPTLEDSLRGEVVEIGNFQSMEYPKDNLYSEEKEVLGKRIFFDPKLSTSQQISFSSCHESQLAWGDGKRVSHGDLRKEVNRNALTIINSGYAKHLFWDGRAKSLEEQAYGPIENEVEMNTSFEVAIDNLKKVEGFA